MTNQIPVVTERNTKKEILEALSVAESLLSKKAEGTFDPAAEAKAKKEVETIEKAESVNDIDSIAAITQLQHQVTDILEKVSSTHDDTVNEFRTVQKAIAIKKEELKELYDIEVKAGTLAALIQAHSDLTEKQKAEYAAANEKLNDELDKLKTEIRDTAKLHIEQQKEEAAKLKQEQDRIKEEWEYEFKRHQKAREDALSDSLAEKRKEFNLEREQLQKDLTDLGEREKAINELEEKVAEIPELIVKAREEAAAAAAEKAKVSYGFETRAIKANYDADTKILTNKVEILEEALRSERAANEALQGKLETAYASVETVAKASVEGARTEQAVKSVLSTINEGKK